MYKGVIKSQTPVDEYEDIPFEVDVNTNNKVSVKDGKVTFNKPGLYEITVEAVVTNCNEGSVKMYLKTNDGMLTEPIAIDTFTEDDEYKTLTICDTIKINRGPKGATEKATLSVVISENLEIYRAFMTVKEIL
jgi:hypothetical protein